MMRCFSYSEWRFLVQSQITNLSWSLRQLVPAFSSDGGSETLFKTLGRSRRWNHKFRCLFGRRYWNPLLFLWAGCRKWKISARTSQVVNWMDCVYPALPTPWTSYVNISILELADTTRSWFSKGSSDYKLWSYPRFVPPVTVYRSIWDSRRADHPATGCH